MTAEPKRETGNPKADARRTETLGLILLSLIVLIVIVIRYWGQIHWSVW